MSFEFERVSISDVCELIVDCVNKTAPKVEYETQFKMIRTPNIRNGVINLDGCNYVSEEIYKKWTRRATVEKDDILLTREAPMGEVGIIDFEDTVFLGQRIMQYRANKSKLCPKFLLYSFLSSELKNQFYQHEGSGSVVSHIRVPDCLKFEINLPPLKIQRKISSFLWGIDQKIKNNNKMNQTLEQMAQALFKSWFVDFEPVKAKMAVLEAGGSQEDATLAAMTAISGKDADALAVFEREHPEQYAELKATAELFPSAMQESELGAIPEGWTLSCLGNHINILNGYAFKSPDYTSEGIFVLRTKNFHSDHYVERLDDDVYLPGYFLKDYLKYNCEPYDYHMVMVGASIGHSAVIYPHTLPALRNQNMWCFRPNGQSVVGKAYTKKIVDEIIGGLKGFASGSAREFFRKGDFENKMIVSANKEIHNLFEKLCFPLIEQQGALCAQSERLSQLRDTLLPKLLSGEITLPEAEQAVSEAENV